MACEPPDGPSIGRGLLGGSVVPPVPDSMLWDMLHDRVIEKATLHLAVQSG
jgi:hypothetical protein